MSEAERIVVSLSRETPQTCGSRIRGLTGREIATSGLELHAEALVRLSAGPLTLGELEQQMFPASQAQARQDFAAFDRRAQVEIGDFFFGLLFGQLDESDRATLLQRQGLELR